QHSHPEIDVSSEEADGFYDVVLKEVSKDISSEINMYFLFQLMAHDSVTLPENIKIWISLKSRVVFSQLCKTKRECDLAFAAYLAAKDLKKQIDEDGDLLEGLGDKFSIGNKAVFMAYISAAELGNILAAKWIENELTSYGLGKSLGQVNSVQDYVSLFSYANNYA
ncbi:MAG: hypothetical protein GQ532_09615, partial [Methylomarinum sp.]|nr:hypothetical protein [Methylomarinum sp.]